MKYRIKIYTFKNGRKEFEAQVKKWFGRRTVIATGEETKFRITQVKREYAIMCIDKHYEGNYKLQTIEFEYITK